MDTNKVLSVIIRIATILTGVFFAALTTWAAFFASFDLQPRIMLSVVCLALTAGFGYFTYLDFKKKK